MTGSGPTVRRQTPNPPVIPRGDWARSYLIRANVLRNRCDGVGGTRRRLEDSPSPPSKLAANLWTASRPRSVDVGQIDFGDVDVWRRIAVLVELARL